LDDIAGNFFLFILKGNDFLFDGIFTSHTVRKYFFVLPNTVTAVDGLIFNSGIPPGVNNVNIVGSG
jgi:hypothetical protein